MIRGNFKIHGLDSSDYGIYFQSRPDIIVPERKVEEIESFAVDGVVLYDEEPTYKEVEADWVFTMIASEDETREEKRQMLYEWFTRTRYVKMIPYFDDEKYWEFRIIGTPRFANRYYMSEHQLATVRVSIKPWKHKVSLKPIAITKGQTLRNPYASKALPLIKIIGDGDCTLTINGKDFKIENVSENIWLDCKTLNAYKEVAGVITNENSKITFVDYPILGFGQNAITWTGDHTIEIEPRWRTLL